MENKTQKPIIIYMLIFSAFLAVALHLDKLSHFFSYFIDITFSLIIGAILAFVLNVPMRGFEKLLAKIDKKHKMKDGLVLGISMVLTILSVLLVIALIIVIVVPNLVTSVKQMYETLEEQLPMIMKSLGEFGIDAEWVESFIAEKPIGEWLGLVGSSASNVLSKLMSGASSTFSVMGSAGIGIVICIYILMDKRALGRRCSKLVGLIFNKETTNRVIQLGHRINETYSAFLTGQCLEAVILGILMVITLSIFRVPYALLISVLAAVLSFIPYIGSFLACAFGAVMIVLTNPIMALVEIIVFFVTQFIEGQFIYPRVVGNSVGLPPIFTLIAAILGGELLGLIGMIFSIPLTAVVYTILRDMASAKARREENITVPVVNENEQDESTTEEG